MVRYNTRENIRRRSTTEKLVLRCEARVAMMGETTATLSSMYSVDDNLMTVLYFENGTATIYSFTEEPKVITL